MLVSVKSSQVKSSQVFKFKMALASFGIAGASDREGRSRRNRHHWIAPSRGIIPIYLLLIIAAPQGFNIVPFSGSLQYHGSRSTIGAIGGARAVPTGQGAGRVWRPPAPRVERARPFSYEQGPMRVLAFCDSKVSLVSGTYLSHLAWLRNHFPKPSRGYRLFRSHLLRPRRCELRAVAVSCVLIAAVSNQRRCTEP